MLLLRLLSFARGFLFLSQILLCVKSLLYLLCFELVVRCSSVGVVLLVARLTDRSDPF